MALDWKAEELWFDYRKNQEIFSAPKGPDHYRVPLHAVMNWIPLALPAKVKQPELDGDHSLAFSFEFKAS